MTEQSTQQQMLQRLAQHRERMAEAGNVATARYDRTKDDAITREMHLYWVDMREYFEQDHDG